MSAMYKIREIGPTHTATLNADGETFTLDTGMVITKEEFKDNYEFQRVIEEDAYTEAWRLNRAICPVYECPLCGERTSTRTIKASDLDDARICENCGGEYIPNQAKRCLTNLIPIWPKGFWDNLRKNRDKVYTEMETKPLRSAAEIPHKKSKRLWLPFFSRRKD